MRGVHLDVVMNTVTIATLPVATLGICNAGELEVFGKGFKPLAKAPVTRTQPGKLTLHHQLRALRLSGTENLYFLHHSSYSGAAQGPGNDYKSQPWK